MKSQKTWFITGASKGLGIEIAKAVLASGDKVVATVRSKPEQLYTALNNNPNLHVVLLDVTNTTIDSVHYSYKWHNPELLSTQGHSLERINPNVSSSDKRN